MNNINNKIKELNNFFKEIDDRDKRLLMNEFKQIDSLKENINKIKF